MIAVSPILHNNNTISQGWTGKEKNNIPVLGNYSKLKYICFHDVLSLLRFLMSR